MNPHRHTGRHAEGEGEMTGCTFVFCFLSLEKQNDKWKLFLGTTVNTYLLNDKSINNLLSLSYSLMIRNKLFSLLCKDY